MEVTLRTTSTTSGCYYLKMQDPLVALNCYARVSGDSVCTEDPAVLWLLFEVEMRI